jgi:hypothetical protein
MDPSPVTAQHASVGHQIRAIGKIERGRTMDKLDSRSDIAKKGADLIGVYWDACKQARIDHRQPGGPRDGAFIRARARCQDGLDKLGLAYPTSLPSSKEAAMRAAYKKFLAGGW